jgi:hypothetical protein
MTTKKIIQVLEKYQFFTSKKPPNEFPLTQGAKRYAYYNSNPKIFILIKKDKLEFYHKDMGYDKSFFVLNRNKDSFLEELLTLINPIKI